MSWNSFKCSSCSQRAVPYFEHYPSDQFEVVDVRCYYLSLAPMVGVGAGVLFGLGAFAGFISLGLAVLAPGFRLAQQLEHWYAVLHNLDEDFDFILEFSDAGVSTRSLSSRDHTLYAVRPRHLIQNGQAIKRWLQSLNCHYCPVRNNCQHFVRALCEFM